MLIVSGIDSFIVNISFIFFFLAVKDWTRGFTADSALFHWIAAQFIAVYFKSRFLILPLFKFTGD